MQQVVRYDSLKSRYENRHFRAEGFFVSTLNLNTKVVEEYIATFKGVSGKPLDTVVILIKKGGVEWENSHEHSPFEVVM